MNVLGSRRLNANNRLALLSLQASEMKYFRKLTDKVIKGELKNAIDEALPEQILNEPHPYDGYDLTKPQTRLPQKRILSQSMPEVRKRSKNPSPPTFCQRVNSFSNIPTQSNSPSPEQNSDDDATVQETIDMYLMELDFAKENNFNQIENAADGRDCLQSIDGRYSPDCFSIP